MHWGGDPMSTFEAMAETLRGGLSLGLCGFAYWAHDIGGSPCCFYTCESWDELAACRWI